MYAQLIQGGTTPERRSEMDRIVTDDMVPALHEEPGFAGALNLVDRESGNALMIVLCEAQARRALAEFVCSAADAGSCLPVHGIRERAGGT